MLHLLIIANYPPTNYHAHAWLARLSIWSSARLPIIPGIIIIPGNTNCSRNYIDAGLMDPDDLPERFTLRYIPPTPVKGKFAHIIYLYS